MDSVELFQRLAIALAIGLLVGIERGWQERAEREGERTAGLRTFALAGLLGGIWGALSSGAGAAQPIALAIAFGVFAAAVTLFRYRETSHDQTFGATTLVAAMLVFGLGAFAVVGSPVVAAAAGIATAGLLAAKSALHGFVGRVTWPELRASLVLLAMAVILLPILPDRPVDPYRALNPREIWLMTVTIAAVSYAGYVAVKVAGERSGIALSSLAGGLVSSTAVTVTMAKLARANPAQTSLLAAGALLAGAVMMVRVAVIAGLLNPALLATTLPALLVAAAVQGGAGVAMLLSRSQDPDRLPLTIANPFELGTVLRLGALIALVMLAAKVLSEWAGPASILALAAASGLADVDAITLSMARLAPRAVTSETAAAAILLAVASNTASKAALAWLTGGAGPGVRIATVSAAALLAGGGTLWLTQL